MRVIATSERKKAFMGLLGSEERCKNRVPAANASATGRAANLKFCLINCEKSDTRGGQMGLVREMRVEPRSSKTTVTGTAKTREPRRTRRPQRSEDSLCSSCL